MLFDRAWEMLDDPERVFLTSEFVRLEVLPKAIYLPLSNRAGCLHEFFYQRCAECIPLSDALLTQTHLEAENAARLGALDALHVAAAKLGGAEEFVTTERLTTALFRVDGPEDDRLSGL